MGEGWGWGWARLCPRRLDQLLLHGLELRLVLAALLPPRRVLLVTLPLRLLLVLDLGDRGEIQRRYSGDIAEI